jgi:serine/threonine-protein kinase
MTPERWREVTRIFHAAAARDSAAREVFLADACGDDAALRAEVDAMLSAHRAAGSFGDKPAFGVARDSTLAPGTRIGTFTIEALLGVGGMGEVYRARDTRLDRLVAIKVLPGLFTADPDRLARFDREARALATLNHPHVGAIYGIEESGGAPALVLELVEGPTLADRLAQGPLRIEEAIDVARQIAEALEAAHERGIVHRDLKPTNIKLTAAGAVKVLDFGLAKLIPAAAAAQSDESTAPTIAATREGFILGTPAYMSPEQARAQGVDKRTDIWAFGCVLYQMLTGRAPFAGPTASDILAQILERDPDWTALPASIPPDVTRLLRRCLTKDPKYRLHDIADARIAIEDATADSPPTPGFRDRRGRQWTIAAGVLLGVLIAGAVAWYVRNGWQSRSGPPRISRVTMASSGTTAVAVTLRSVALTPDGRRVAYIGNNGSQIFVRELDQLEPVTIVTGTRPLNGLFLSPDGRSVGFSEGNALRRVPIAGGPANTIATSAFGGATWTPDETIVFGDNDPTTGLQRVPARGGHVTMLTTPARDHGELDHLWPEMLPDGQSVLFTITASVGGPDAAQIAVLDLKTLKSRVLLRGGSDARYVPGGYLVYVAAGTMRAVRFDLARLETRGTPVTVLPRLATLLGSGNFDLASDGTLAYVDAPDASSAALSTLVWLDREGREEPLGLPPRAYQQPRISPDGKRLAVYLLEGESDIWTADIGGRSLSQLTFDPVTDFTPVWLDSARIVYSQLKGNSLALLSKRADGTGVSQALGAAGLASGVTPDGRQLLFHSANSQNRELMIMQLETGQVSTLVAAPSQERNGVVSPDGRWLAYESNRSGDFEIYVQSFPDLKGQWKVSPSGGTKPLWARGQNGIELFYVGPDGTIEGVHLHAGSQAWSADPPTKLVDGPYALTSQVGPRTYDVSPDGRRFLVVKPAKQVTAPQIVVWQHWVEEDLKRLAPTN